MLGPAGQQLLNERFDLGVVAEWFAEHVRFGMCVDAASQVGGGVLDGPHLGLECDGDAGLAFAAAL